MWLSLVERSFRVGEVGSSNLPIPTIKFSHPKLNLKTFDFVSVSFKPSPSVEFLSEMG